MTKKRRAHHNEAWAHAKRVCRLSARQVEMARALGMNPKKLPRLRPAPQEHWKLPVGAFIEECFQKLGRWIKSCHAKDLVWVNSGALHFEEAIPGRGGIDFRRYLRHVTAASVPLIIEHLDGPTAYAEAWQYLTSLADDLRSMAMSGPD